MSRKTAPRRFVALLLALVALGVSAPVALADDGTADTGKTETSPPGTQPTDAPPAGDTGTDEEPAADSSDGDSSDSASGDAGSSDGPAEAPADDSAGDASGGGGEASGETTTPAGDDAVAGDDGSADEAGGAGAAACESEGEESECPPSEAEADAEEAAEDAESAEDEESAEGDHAVTPKATQKPPPAPAPPAPAPQQSVVIVFNTQPEAPRLPQVSPTVLPTESAPTVGRGAGAPLPAAYEVLVIPSLLAPATSHESAQGSVGSVRSIVVASSTQTFQFPVAGSAIALWYNAGRAPAGRPSAVLADAEARAAKRHAGGPERRTDAKPRPREQVTPSWGSDSAFGRGSGTREKTATAHHRQLAVPVGFRPLATPRETQQVSAPEARPHSASPLSPLERPG